MGIEKIVGNGEMLTNVAKTTTKAATPVSDAINKKVLTIKGDEGKLLNTLDALANQNRLNSTKYQTSLFSDIGMGTRGTYYRALQESTQPKGTISIPLPDSASKT